MYRDRAAPDTIRLDEGLDPMTTHMQPGASSGTGLDWLPTTCEMAELVRAHDWASTSLGHPSTWPCALRNAVSLCLSTNFPILVLWGPELVKIYNDGYRDMVGGPSKHPRALGAPVAEIWPEIWDTIGPMFESVVTTGVATWSEHEPLLIDRSGFTEECTFTFSYSPLFDDDGQINGVLDISVETTKEIVQTRRLECIADLNAALGHAGPGDRCVHVGDRGTQSSLARHRRRRRGAERRRIDGADRLQPPLVAGRRPAVLQVGRCARPAAADHRPGAARFPGRAPHRADVRRRRRGHGCVHRLAQPAPPVRRRVRAVHRRDRPDDQRVDRARPAPLRGRG